MLRKILTRRMIAANEMLPRWYGVAWQDPLRDATVCYPVPLNLLLRFARWLWLAVRFPRYFRRVEQHDFLQNETQKAYEAGYRDGRIETLMDRSWRMAEHG